MKNPLKSRSLIGVIAAGISVLAFATTSMAQTRIFFEDWEINHKTDNTYVTNFISAGSAVNATNNLADLFCDYSTMGVPLSPHSTNSGTHALKLCCNLVPATVFPTGVSVSPVGFGITDNFDMHFDGWFNFDGPFPGGGPGSTEIGGAGYGTAGTNAQVAGIADCVYIGAATDANTASSVRVYSSGHTISYQSGAYRVGSSGTDPAILGDPSTGFVYAGTNGGRDLRAAPFITEFPGQQCPAAQFALYPQQTNSNGTLPGQPGFAQNGALSFAWHDISLSKVANVITYKIDGFLIATVDVVDAGPLGGSNILFNMYDINNTGDTQTNATNLLFFLVDNVRITNFPNVVSVSNSTASIFEGSNTPGIFTIIRTSSGVPLTVNYTMSGSASNGVDYTNALGQPLSGSVTFAANATSTNIQVFAVADGIPELTESIILNIQPSTNYTGAGNATIRIVDNDPPQLTITNLSTQVYKRTNDYAVFQISRLGSTNKASFPINLTFSGTAAYGVDIYTNINLTFEPGVSTTNINVYPIETAYKGNQTITVSISTGGTNYSIGSPSSATVTLVAAGGPPETVLFSDSLQTDTSANWTVLTAANDGNPDNSVAFGFDYSSQNIPSAPHSAGDTHGLFLTVNKLDATPAAAAVNLYPNGQNFSGNYALRCDMWLNIITNSTITTEYAMLGLNHSGTKTNWWRSGGVPTNWLFDGVFYTIETDAQSSPNFVNYSSPNTNNNPTMLTAGTNSSGFTSAFKSPPWTVAGSPAATSTATGTAGPPPWSEVELSQIGGIQTLKINNTVIFSYTNTTPYTSGNIMLGYEDAFDSVGDVHSYVVFANLRVIKLTAPQITSIQNAGGTVTLNFTSDPGLTAGQYVLQSASVVTGPYVDTASTITTPSSGQFHVTATAPAGSEYFRVRRVF